MGSRLSRLNRVTPLPEQPQDVPAQISQPHTVQTSQPVFERAETSPGTKRRTAPRIAALRKQLRPKLLSTSDEFDLMDSANPEHQQIIRDRLKVVLQRAGVQLTPDELTELEQALIYDLLGFGAIEPLVRDKSFSEIMVNGPDLIFAE